MRKIEARWYEQKANPLLIPLSYLYQGVSALRRLGYQQGIFTQHKFAVPIIVVGNISVGGTGKTPLVCYLANQLTEQGYRPGIVSRGYRGKARQYPQWVTMETTPELVGDEAVLIASKTACPMVVSPNRPHAVSELLANTDCNIIISDDGLQHYALKRDIEIAVVDGERGLGNGYCLPAGPLREPAERLNKVDFIIQNGGEATAGRYQMNVEAEALYNLKDPHQRLQLAQLQGQTVHAVAGIGNPQRFFNQLKQFDCRVIPHAFKDHHPFTAQDLEFNDDLMVIMTEKDAVKCQSFAKKNYWAAPVSIDISDDFIKDLLSTYT